MSSLDSFESTNSKVGVLWEGYQDDRYDGDECALVWVRAPS
jgi:hypothetical protein